MSLQWFEPYILGEVSFGLWLTAFLFNESHELYMISYPYSLSFFYDVSFVAWLTILGLSEQSNSCPMLRR